MDKRVKFGFLFLWIIILLLILPFISGAHYIAGIVYNATDGTLPDGHTILVWRTVDPSTNTTDIVGPSGYSAANNFYMIDCELYLGCVPGDNISAQIMDDGSNYASNLSSVLVSEFGYDMEPEIQLYHNISTSSISILSPNNNSAFNLGEPFYTNATISCVGPEGTDCGLISAYVNYNQTLINTTENAIPFFVSLLKRNITELADAFVHQSFPTSNFGSYQTLYAGFDSGGEVRSWLKFNINSIPFWAVIKTAYLNLYKDIDGDLNKYYSLYNTTDNSWGELTINWNNRPVSTTEASSLNMTTAGSMFVSWNITKLVQDMVNSNNNLSMELRQNGTLGSVSTRFASKDAANSATRPYLEINFSTPNPIASLSPLLAGQNLTVSWLINGSQKGFYNIYVFYNSSINSTGENSSKMYVSIGDLTSPSISLVYPVNTTYFTNISNINYLLNESNPAYCWYSKNNGLTNSTLVSGGVNFTNMNSIEGLNNLTVFCNDTSDNKNFTMVYYTIDTFPPYFTTIPDNASIFYLNQSLLVTFAATDIVGFGYYSINDSRFSINQTGFLSNATILGAGNYQLNITVNDTSNKINWTIYNVQVNKSMENCKILFNATSPVTYPATFKVWANCSTPFTLYRNGSVISNNSEQILSPSIYNFSMLRTDTQNYTYYYNETQFTVRDLTPPTYSHQSINNTFFSNLTNFAINVSDDYSLTSGGAYIFSTNNTGQWVNDSPVLFLTTPSWANVTKMLNDTLGIRVGYRWYFNDSSNNTVATPQYNLDIPNYNTWIMNFSINNSLPSIGSFQYSHPTVFQIGSQWYMISGALRRMAGFAWDGTQWLPNDTINASLPTYGVDDNLAPTVFYKDSSWYMISGEKFGHFYGYVWTGTQWIVNTTINNSLPTFSRGYTNPTVFQKDGTWYLITGGLDGGFNGFSWDGTQWVTNTAITSSLPANNGNFSSPSAFQKDGTWYIISSNLNDGYFFGYRWNGTDWNNNFVINASLPHGNVYNTPDVFYKDSSWYLLSGRNDGRFYGYTYYQSTDIIPPYFTNIPANASLFYGNESLGVDFDADDDRGMGYYSINDSRFSINQTGFLSNATSLAVGNYQINVTINDSSGNVNWTGYSVTIKKNQEQCKVLFNETSPLEYTNSFLVWANCSTPFTLRRNGTVISNNSLQSGLSVGTYNFSMQRTDSQNYTYYYNDTQFVIKDTTPPTSTPSMTSPPGGATYVNNTWTSQNVQITISASDTGVGYNPLNFPVYCVDTTNTCEPSTPISAGVTISSEGVNYIRFYSNDSLGNKEQTQFRVIKIDKTSPTLTIDSPTNYANFSYNTSIPFNFSTADSYSGLNTCFYSFDGGAYNYSLPCNLNYWVKNLTINASLPSLGGWSRPTVFYKDSSLYMIAGNTTGYLFGFVWDGTQWVTNTTINASLPRINSGSAAPAVFYKDSSWYLISGDFNGDFNGFAYNNSDLKWYPNSTIVAGLAGTPFDSSIPEVFQMGNDWYMLAGEKYGNFYGYAWNGTQWNSNTTINSSLPNIGNNTFPSVFQMGSKWYMISGELYGKFFGYAWNGTDWNTDLVINSSLPDVGSYSAPTIFYKDTSWYMISGESSGKFFGYLDITHYVMALSEGVKTLTFFVNDMVNNWNSTSVTFTIDLTKPLITFGTIQNNTYKNNNFIWANVNVTELNEKNITFSLYNNSLFNSSTYTDGRRTINWTDLADGEYWFNVTIFDYAGNSNTTSNYKTTLDRINPSIEYNPSSDSNNTYRNSGWAFINITASDINKNTIKLNFDGVNESFTTNDGDYYWKNKTGLSEGNHSFYAWINDSAGNFNLTANYTIVIDLTNPTINLILPEAASYNYNNSLPLNFSILDTNLNTCWYNLDDTTNITISCYSNTTFNTSEATHILNLFANDSSGRESVSSVTFTVNLAPPGLVLNYPTNGAWEKFNNITIQYTPSDTALDVCQVWTNITGSWNLNYTELSPITDNLNNLSLIIPDGHYIINVWCNNTGGNGVWADIVNKTFNVDSIYPHILYGGGIQNNTNLTNTFISPNVTVTELNEKNITFSLYNNSLFNSSTYTDGRRTINWTDLADGEYWFNVTIFDYAGNSNTTSNYKTTLDNTPPTISIQTPLSQNYGNNNSMFLNYTTTDNLIGLDTCWYYIYYTNGTLVKSTTLLASCINDTFSLPGGDNNFTLTLFSRDRLLNTNYQAVTFGIRTVAPAIQLYPPTDSNVKETDNNYFNFTVSTNSDNISTCEFWINSTGAWHKNQTILDALFNGTQNTFFPLNLSEGSYTWNVWCNDSFDYSDWALNNNTFVVDLTSPVINITSPLNGSSSTATSVLFNYTIIDANMYFCQFNAYSNGSWEYSPNQSLSCLNGSRSIVLTIGTHDLYIWGEDKAGNVNQFKITFTITSAGLGGGGGGGGTTIIAVPANGTFCGDGICQTNGNDLGIKEDFFSCSQDCQGFNVDSAIFYCFDDNVNTVCIWDSVKYEYVGLFLGILAAVLAFSTIEDKKTKKQVPLIRYYFINKKRKKDKKGIKKQGYRRV